MTTLCNQELLAHVFIGFENDLIHETMVNLRQ